MTTERFRKMVLLGYGQGDFDQSCWEGIDKLTDEKILISPDDGELPVQMHDADCLLVKLGQGVDKNLIDLGSRLKYIGILGTGYGRIDVSHASRRGIVVCNIAGYSTEAVAEFAFGIILGNLRELVRARVDAHAGTFAPHTFEGREIRGKAFGVVGLGNIGSRIARIACGAFGARVTYWSRTRKPDHEKEGIEYQELDVLLRTSDFISLNLALTPETKHILDATRLSLIKPGALLVNLSPIELVDMHALKERLTRNDCTVILDHTLELSATEIEELMGYRNCELYPSIAYLTSEATTAKRTMFIDNLVGFLSGNPTNRVN